MIYKILLDVGGVKTFKFETEPGSCYSKRKKKRGKPLHRRTSYRVDWFENLQRYGDSRTTYRLCPSRRVILYPCILAVNRKIYNEASPLLYENRIFDFGTSLEALQPFFNDLTFESRQMIQEVSLLKQYDVPEQDRRDYTVGFNATLWNEVCSYVALNLHLHKLALSVSCTCDELVPQASHPQEGLTATEWERMVVSPYSVEWIKNLLKIRGLRELEVRSTEDFEYGYRGPTPQRDIFLKNSIEIGLGKYLRAVMLTPGICSPFMNHSLQD